MKKTVKYLAFFLGLALASCSKNEIAPDPKPVEGPKMQVTLNAGATKTALVQDGKTDNFNPIWTAGDKLGVFVHSNGSEVDNNVATSALAADTETATFNVAVSQPSQAAKYKFYAYYPYSSLDDQSNTNVRVNIPTEQHPANGSFDPKADVLSGLPKEVNVTAGQEEITGLELQFMRKTSVVRFLIPSCQDFEGITKDTYVEEVKVYFDKPVAGVANFNIENTDDITLEAGRDSSVVTLKYASNTHKVSDPLWLSIAPVEGVKSLTFAFKVADNAYLYAKAEISKGVDFAAGGMIKFDIPINATSWELKSFQKKYVKVTSTPDSWLGKYLIVGANGDPVKLYACNQVYVGSWGTCSEVTPQTDGSILGDTDVNSYAFDVVPGIADETYAFKFTSGNYKGQFVSSGAAKNFNVLEDTDSAKTDFTLAVDGGYVTIASKTTSNRQLRYNHNGGSGGLRFYDGTTANPVSLYKQEEDYSAIVPVIANPVGIPEEVAKEGVTDAKFTAGITYLSKYSVSIDGETGFDKNVVTAASVSYNSGNNTATITYSVSANTGEPRDGWIILKAGPTERKIDIHQATGIALPEITDVPDQNITYEASDARSFDVTIANVGSFTVSCEKDGTVVTEASAEHKSGDVYTVTYTVTENTGMEKRNGSITINCSTVSSTVKIIQNYNVAGVKTYKRVASLSDIEPGRYVIVASTSSITAYLPNAFNTSSAPTAETTGFTCTDSEFKTLDDSAAWDFTGTTSAMTIKSAADTANYLYINGSNNNGIRIGTKSDTWTIAKHGSNTEDNLFQLKDVTNNRFVGIYKDNPDWRSYTSYNHDNYSSSKIKLYILDDGKTKPTITTTPKTITTLGSQDVSEMFSSDSDGAKSYSVSGGTLDGTTFTASEAGSYTVTMTQEATATYKAAQAQATITVEVAPTLTAPEILTEGDNTNKKITVTWSDVDNATSYTVHCNSATYNVLPEVEIYEITGLEYGVQYDIYVSASADGYYPSESEHKAVTLTDPAVQTLASPVVTTSVSGTIVTVNWVDVANATSYYVECGTHNTTVNSGVQTAEFICTAGDYDVKVTAKASGYNDGVSDTKQVVVNEKLATPTGLAAPSASITSSSIKLTWNAVSHADAGYQVSNDGTSWTDVAAGTTEYTFTDLDASTEYTLYVKAKASGYYTVSDAASKTVTTFGASKTYHHTFSTKPDTGNKVTLSNMNWNISATALNAYNSGYAGVQFGTSKATGDITLTSSAAWNYQSTTNVKEIRVWLNTGGGMITPTVTIGGTSVASDGTTVTKKSSLNGDYTKANKVTFKPSSSMTGVIIISVAKTPASGGAGYICAIEVDSE